jgi:hypothetical protein
MASLVQNDVFTDISHLGRDFRNMDIFFGGIGHNPPKMPLN